MCYVFTEVSTPQHVISLSLVCMLHIMITNRVFCIVIITTKYMNSKYIAKYGNCLINGLARYQGEIIFFATQFKENFEMIFFEHKNHFISQHYNQTSSTFFPP